MKCSSPKPHRVLEATRLCYPHRDRVPGRSCESLTENALLERAQGILSPDEAAKLDEHMDVCATCRALLAEAMAPSTDESVHSHQSATFEPGETIANRYVVERWLGAGGMGEVYAVIDSRLGEEIALKTIAASVCDDPRALSRLTAEVRLARRVTHENVCRVYDLGTCERRGDAVAFLTMELVSGITLRRRLAESGSPEIPMAKRWLRQIARGLAHAHAAGVVHRDLKPDNVMLGPGPDGGDRIVLMDFGLAALAGWDEPPTDYSNTRSIVGTLDYVSPEQLEGKEASTASDVYAFGLLAFEVLTGRLPFDSGTAASRALQRMKTRAARASRFRSDIDPTLDRIVSLCLEISPSRRPESMRAVLALLEGRGSKRLVSSSVALIIASAVVGAGVAAYAVRPHADLGASTPTPKAPITRHPTDITLATTHASSIPSATPPLTEASASREVASAKPIPSQARARSQSRSHDTPPRRDAVHLAPHSIAPRPPTNDRNGLLDPYATTAVDDSFPAGH